MTDYSIGFTDPDLYSLYTAMQGLLCAQRPHRGDRPCLRTDASGEIDAGTVSLGYTQASSRTTATSADHLIDTSELFRTVVSDRVFQGAYQRFANEPLPWVATSDRATQDLLREFDAMAARWRNEHPGESLQSEAFAQRIYDFVTNSSEMGMRHNPTAPELNVAQIAVQREGDCTEYTKIFLLLGRRAGISVKPRWVQRDLNGEEPVHIVAGFDIGGRTFLLDPIYGRFNPSHQSVSEMSWREFLAWHWNNRALDVQGSSPDRALQFFSRALAMDPENPHFLLNRGILRGRRRDAALAKSDFEAALRAVPNFHYAHFQLGNLEYDAGHYREARSLFRRALSQAPQNQSYLRNLVLALFYSGERQASRRELGRLVAINPSHGDLIRLVGSPIRS